MTGVPDEQRGERLVVLYTRPDLAPDELWRRLSETDLPKLWLPKRENIYQVDSVPVLGNGQSWTCAAVKAKALQLGPESRQRSGGSQLFEFHDQHFEQLVAQILFFVFGGPAPTDVSLLVLRGLDLAVRQW